MGDVNAHRLSIEEQSPNSIEEVVNACADQDGPEDQEEFPVVHLLLIGKKFCQGVGPPQHRLIPTCVATSTAQRRPIGLEIRCTLQTGLAQAPKNQELTRA